MVMIINQSTFLKHITTRDINSLKTFLNTAGSSLKSFRYFDKRNFSVLNNHIVTYLLFHKQEPVGYGHLDKENNKVWLGISIVESKQGMGFGNILMTNLLEAAITKNISAIYLSVDGDNHKAIQLYEKFGFRKEAPALPPIIKMKLIL